MLANNRSLCEHCVQTLPREYISSRKPRSSCTGIRKAISSTNFKSGTVISVNKCKLQFFGRLPEPVLCRLFKRNQISWDLIAFLYKYIFNTWCISNEIPHEKQNKHGYFIADWENVISPNKLSLNLSLSRHYKLVKFLYMCNSVLIFRVSIVCR